MMEMMLHLAYSRVKLGRMEGTLVCLWLSEKTQWISSARFSSLLGTTQILVSMQLIS